MHSHRIPSTLYLLSLALAATLASCASGPYQTTLHVQGGEKLNPTFNNEPSSVNIRIVQMKDREAFDNATEEQLLSEDLTDRAKNPWVIALQDATVRVALPGELPVAIKADVRFVGIVGMFNESNGQWRAVLDVDTLNNVRLVFDNYAFSSEPIE
ncbi:MAG: type VI secretion system VasD/TssJ family lipoprotein [Planctomycetota bacterium]|jgi:type VI secretion system VasD/TssJ family lipoprotein